MRGNMIQMSLPQSDPVPGYRFVVFLNDTILSFQRVSGMCREIETEIYHEGGRNTMVHTFPKACGGERTLRMEKGIFGGVEHMFCLVGERLEGVMNLVVMDHQGTPLKNYAFTGLLVRKWEVGELSAEQNGVLIDSFEVSYEYFYVVK